MRSIFALASLAFGLLAFAACTGPTRVFETEAELGQACSGAEDCGSGNCVDRVCCESACDGQCEACNVAGSEGRCVPIKGAPQEPRQACGSPGVCAGTCDGKSTDCTFPAAGTFCSAGCDQACDGAGTCKKDEGACPNGFACGASGCLDHCSGDADCQRPNFTCNGGKCERVPESDCLDGDDNNGDTLADCQDPSCKDQVECVDKPDTGDVGLLITTGACPAHYEQTEPFSSGFQPKACEGCTCKTVCSGKMNVWTNTTCVGAPVATTLTGFAGDTACANIPTDNYVAGSVTSVQSSGCTAGGAATQEDPTWAQNLTFCRAKTSKTCGSGSKVCVAKRPAGTALCARVGAADSCPAAYNAEKTPVATGFSPGSCGACSTCNAAPPAWCEPFPLGDQVLTGPTCSGGGSPVADSSCNLLSRAPPFKSVELTFTGDGNDPCTPNVTDTPPTETGKAQICCAAAD